MRIGRLGGENFLAGPSARPLTDDFYAGNLSARNAQQIERLERQADRSRRRSVAEGRLADVVS